MCFIMSYLFFDLFLLLFLVIFIHIFFLQTDRMIQQARMLPHEMRNHNRRQLEEGRLTNDENVYLHAFGVSYLQ